jgi:hypothetical protein
LLDAAVFERDVAIECRRDPESGETRVAAAA